MNGEAPGTATPRELLARLKEELPKAVPTTMSASGPLTTPGHDLYEAYLFCLVLAAARREDYDVAILDHAERPARGLRLRMGPGRLSTFSGFTHAELRLPSSGKDPLEVHTGVRVIGKSGVAHEADVLLIKRADARRCRRGGTDPRSRNAMLIVEGKYYTKEVTLGVARGFLGLQSDLSNKPTMFAATISYDSARVLLQERGVHFELGVLPSRKGEHDLRERFGQVLRGYKRAR